MDLPIAENCASARFSRQLLAVLTAPARDAAEADIWRRIVKSLVYALNHVKTVGQANWYNAHAARTSDYTLIGKVYDEVDMQPALELLVLASQSRELPAGVSPANSDDVLRLDARALHALVVMKAFSFMTRYGNGAWPGTTQEELQNVRTIQAEPALLFALDAAVLQLFMLVRGYATAYGAVSNAVKKTAPPGTRMLLAKHLPRVGAARILANELDNYMAASATSTGNVTADSLAIVLDRITSERRAALASRLA